MRPPRRRPFIRLLLPVGAAIIVLSSIAARVSATPHTVRVVGGAATLRDQVVRQFDRLDRVGREIERLRDEMARIDDRISSLSRQVEAAQELLNRRAAEAYMAGRAGEIESVLGAQSLGDLQDALLFIEALSQRDHDLLVSFQQRRGELEVQRDRLEGLADGLRRKRDRLEAAASELAAELRRQVARARVAEGETAPEGSVVDAPTSVTTSESSAPTPPWSREAITGLIRERFASLGAATTRVALCVVEHESNFEPLVVNPATEASGLFQFLPSTWQVLSDLAGWSGASVFDARANASVAAWTVAHYGWHPWRSVAAVCGA